MPRGAMSGHHEYLSASDWQSATAAFDASGNLRLHLRSTVKCYLNLARGVQFHGQTTQTAPWQASKAGR